MVKFPSVRDGKTIERLYGIDVIGDVPRDPLVMAEIPRERISNPHRNTA